MKLPEEDLRRCIGLEASYVAPEPVGEAVFRYFAEAIGDANPVYTEPREGRGRGYGTVIAPPTWICESNQYTGLAPDANGYSGHQWPLGLEGATWIRGGNVYRFGRPVRPDDRIHVTWRLVRAENKVTRDGTEMVLIISEGTYRSERGEFLASNRETMFFR